MQYNYEEPFVLTGTPWYCSGISGRWSSVTTSLLISSVLGSGGTRLWNGSSCVSAQAGVTMHASWREEWGGRKGVGGKESGK